jgi:HTH-type transcriptional regulator/antitoxin MqsA
MVSPETGEPLFRDVRPFTVEYRDKSITVQLPGWYPDGEGDGIHVGEDLAVVDAALADLKKR